jgi:hypothetical protein
MKIVKTLSIIFLSALLASVFYVHAEPATPSIEALLNEMAEKPEHHQAISTYYRTLAADARAEAEKHKTMQSTYRHSHSKLKGQGAGRAMADHCERLTQLQLSVAEEYEALAELHEKEAQ